MQVKKIRKTQTKEKDGIDPQASTEFINKASKATKKILSSISKSFDPSRLEQEFQNEISEIDENKILTFQSKLPQLIELLTFKALEFILQPNFTLFY